MTKWEKAQVLLYEKIRKCDFKDDVYTMVDNIIGEKISKVETELGMSDSDVFDDDVAWYDEIKEEMRFVLYDRISKWLCE